MILGLRRTLAFQIVEAARHPEPFPRIAVWAVMAGLMGLAGRLLLRGWGGHPVLGRSAIRTAAGSDRPLARRAGLPIVLASTLALTGAAVLGWLPVLGLFRLVLYHRPNPVASDEVAARSFTELIRQVFEPPMPQLAANSLFLGLEVATGIVILAWLVRPVAAQPVRHGPSGRALSDRSQ